VSRTNAAFSPFGEAVCPIFVLLDQPLQADVTPDLVAQVVALEQEEQSGHPPVAVAERVDTEKIEIERRHENQGVNSFVT
jgi:hypothetical protein